MKNKKIVLFLLSLVLTLGLPVTAFAQEYGNEYPDYVNYSGGAYFEVVSTFGQGTCIFQSDKKDDIFGFNNSSYNICNISNSTITGRYIAEDGTEYTCRFAAYSNLEIYLPKTTGSNTTYTWTEYKITQILNTNVNFIDLTDNGRDTAFQGYVFSNEYGMLEILLIVVIVLIVIYLITEWWSRKCY